LRPSDTGDRPWVSRLRRKRNTQAGSGLSHCEADCYATTRSAEAESISSRRCIAGSYRVGYRAGPQQRHGPV